MGRGGMNEPLLATGRGRGAPGVMGRGRGRSGMPVDGGADARVGAGDCAAGARVSSGARGDGGVRGSASSGGDEGEGGANRSMDGAAGSYATPRSPPGARSAGESAS